MQQSLSVVECRATLNVGVNDTEVGAEDIEAVVEAMVGLITACTVATQRARRPTLILLGCTYQMPTTYRSSTAAAYLLHQAGTRLTRPRT